MHATCRLVSKQVKEYVTNDKMEWPKNIYVYTRFSQKFRICFPNFISIDI
jgi:hypothetical protein